MIKKAKKFHKIEIQKVIIRELSAVRDKRI